MAEEKVYFEYGGGSYLEAKVYFEYGDGSYLEALVKDGKLIECPIIKISPPAEWGGGAFTLDGAIDFLEDIKTAMKRTRIAAENELEKQRHKELILKGN